MAKRSHKRPVRHEKDQLGCMGGLINMFDFRHGRMTHKLLSDRRHGSKHFTSSESRRRKPDTLTSGRKGEGTLDEGETTGADGLKPSVKKLIEEAMLVENNKKNEDINPEGGNTQQDWGHLDQKQKNRRRKKENHSQGVDEMHDLDTAKALGSGSPCDHHHQSGHHISGNLDMDNLVEEFCHQIYQRTVDCSKHDQLGEICLQPNHNIADFREKLTEVVKLLVSQKLINAESLTLNGKLKSSEELMEALRILSSDEDLILKLIRDPNSLVVKYAPDLSDSRLKKDEESDPLSESNFSAQKLGSSTKPEEHVSRKQRNFFRRKAKSKESNDLQASNKIVILKPAPVALQYPETGSRLGMSVKQHNIGKSREANEKGVSQFSLAEIKRKFKHAMGKEHRRTSSDGISMIPVDRQIAEGGGGMVKEYAGMSSPTKDHFFIERIARPPVGHRKKEKKGKIKNSDESSNLSKQKVTNIYVEAKKHLSDMLSNDHGEVDLKSRRGPKTLGKILSLPEYTSSPAGNPATTEDATAQVKLTASDEVQKITDKNITEHDSHLNQTLENSENKSCSTDSKTAAEVQDYSLSLRTSVEGANDNHENGTSPTRNYTTPEGTGWIPEDTAIVIREVTASSSPGEGKYVNDTTVTDEKSQHESSKQYSCEGDEHSISQLDSPPHSLIKKKVEFPETHTDIQERPSPVSVLEQPFTEDVISPLSTRFPTSETSILPQKIRFEESDSEDARDGTNEKTFVDDKEIVFRYVKSVLDASSLSWDELLAMSLPSQQLLNSCLLDEVELPSNQLCLNQRLLFDCINEVLTGLQEHYFGSSPWVSSIKPAIRPITNVKNFSQEVWQGVLWHLLPLPLPCTLDHIVRKDMAKSGTWLDLCLETDCIGTEMSEAILRDLMEDTILSYDAENQGDASSTQDELKKNGSSSVHDSVEID